MTYDPSYKTVETAQVCDTTNKPTNTNTPDASIEPDTTNTPSTTSNTYFDNFFPMSFFINIFTTDTKHTRETKSPLDNLFLKIEDIDIKSSVSLSTIEHLKKKIETERKFVETDKNERSLAMKTLFEEVNKFNLEHPNDQIDTSLEVSVMYRQYEFLKEKFNSKKNSTNFVNPNSANSMQTDTIQTDTIQTDTVQTDIKQTHGVQNDFVQNDFMQNDIKQSDNEKSDTMQNDVKESDTVQSDIVQLDIAQSDIVQSDTVETEIVSAEKVTEDFSISKNTQGECITKEENAKGTCSTC